MTAEQLRYLRETACSRVLGRIQRGRVNGRSERVKSRVWKMKIDGFWRKE